MTTITDQAASAVPVNRPRLMKLTDVVTDGRWPWATSRSLLTKLCADGALNPRRIGKAYWVSAEDLDEYEESRLVRRSA